MSVHLSGRVAALLSAGKVARNGVPPRESGPCQFRWDFRHADPSGTLGPYTALVSPAADNDGPNRRRTPGWVWMVYATDTLETVASGRARWREDGMKAAEAALPNVVRAHVARLRAEADEWEKAWPSAK